MKETLKINGMSCGGCVNGVRRVLSRLPLTQVTVEIGSAEVEYDETKVTRREIIRTINAGGYEVVDTEPMAATH